MAYGAYSLSKPHQTTWEQKTVYFQHTQGKGSLLSFYRKAFQHLTSLKARGSLFESRLSINRPPLFLRLWTCPTAGPRCWSASSLLCQFPQSFTPKKVGRAENSKSQVGRCSALLPAIAFCEKPYQPLTLHLYISDMESTPAASSSSSKRCCLK